MFFGALVHSINPGIRYFVSNYDFLNPREFRSFYEDLSKFYVTLGNDDMFLRH
jgi:hypothetical protein